MDQRTRQRHASSKARKAKNRERSAAEIAAGLRARREVWKPKHHLAMSQNDMDVAWAAAMGLAALSLPKPHRG